MLCFCGISSSSTFYLRVPRSGQFRPQRPLSNKWLVTQIRSKKMTRLPSFALLPPFSTNWPTNSTPLSSRSNTSSRAKTQENNSLNASNVAKTSPLKSWPKPASSLDNLQHDSHKKHPHKSKEGANFAAQNSPLLCLLKKELQKLSKPSTMGANICIHKYLPPLPL